VYCFDGALLTYDFYHRADVNEFVTTQP
jgi:hypothetical protein